MLARGQALTNISFWKCTAPPWLNVSSLTPLGRVCAWAEQNGMAVLPHYSPGYTGWPVSDQPKLWNVIRGENSSPFPDKLEVMESGCCAPKNLAHRLRPHPTPRKSSAGFETHPL